MSPDPYDGSYEGGDPQSLNRYAYVANGPLSYLDPLGDDLICSSYQYSTSISKRVHAMDSGVYTICFDTGSSGGGGYVTGGAAGSSVGPGTLPMPTRTYDPRDAGCPSAFTQKVAKAVLSADSSYTAMQALARRIHGTVLKQFDASGAIGIPEAGNLGGSLSVQAGIAVDQSGNVAIVLSGSAGMGFGGGGAIGANVTVSKAVSVFQLAGPSASVTVGGGDGIGGSVNVSTNGGGALGVTAGAAVGGYGGSFSSGPSKVIPIVCGGG